MIIRGPLTDLVIETIGALGKPVGDSDAPDPPFGWDGQPNAIGTNYVPYVVVTPMSVSYSEGPVAISQADWHLPYAVASHGVSRLQCEWLADRSRESLQTLRHQFVLLESNYKIQQVRTDIIGAITRNDSSDPPFFTQVDVISIWLTKEL